jgi:hypothetical protein
MYNKIMSSNNDDCNSICSAASSISVSYNENEVPLDEAVDDIFKQIQEHINQIHVELRSMVMSDDRGEDYTDCFEYHESLTEHVKEACLVFRDVIKVSKQLLPSKPKGWVNPKKGQGAGKLLDM